VAVSPRPVNMELGNLLRLHRRNSGVSQKALSERSGISQTYISTIENGRRRSPDAEIMSRLAVTLGLSQKLTDDFMAAAGHSDYHNSPVSARPATIHEAVENSDLDEDRKQLLHAIVLAFEAEGNAVL
jgi:transcriptional regulator with XRE-family HTH domain